MFMSQTTMMYKNKIDVEDNQIDVKLRDNLYESTLSIFKDLNTNNDLNKIIDNKNYYFKHSDNVFKEFEYEQNQVINNLFSEHSKNTVTEKVKKYNSFLNIYLIIVTIALFVVQLSLPNMYSLPAYWIFTIIALFGPITYLQLKIKKSSKQNPDINKIETGLIKNKVNSLIQKTNNNLQSYFPEVKFENKKASDFSINLAHSLFITHQRPELLKGYMTSEIEQQLFKFFNKNNLGFIENPNEMNLLKYLTNDEKINQKIIDYNDKSYNKIKINNFIKLSSIIFLDFLLGIAKYKGDYKKYFSQEEADKFLKILLDIYNDSLKLQQFEYKINQLMIDYQEKITINPDLNSENSSYLFNIRQEQQDIMNNINLTNKKLFIQSYLIPMNELIVKLENQIGLLNRNIEMRVSSK